MRRKTIFVTLFIFCFGTLVFNTAYAADTVTELPGRSTFVIEWINLNILTWKSKSKVIVLNDYATRRVQEIKIASDTNNDNQINNLVQRYSAFQDKINTIMNQKKIQNKATLVDTIRTQAIEQQKILSQVRQNTESEEVKKIIASTQEENVSKTKDLISNINGKDEANSFASQIITAWRDPNNSVKDEKTTRVYAAGTESTNNNANNGVIIDGGEAKITQNNTGDLKIEYAPGTGPSSVVGDNGKKIWKIQMSDGTVAESYTTAGRVVIGQSGQTTTNIIVNSVSGGTTGTQRVIQGDGNSTGTGGVKIEGGLPGVVGGSSGTGGVKVEGNTP